VPLSPTMSKITLVCACLVCTGSGWQVQAKESEAEVGQRELESLKALAALVLPAAHPAGAFIGRPYAGRAAGSLRPRQAATMGLEPLVPGQLPKEGEPGYKRAKAKKIIGEFVLGEEKAEERRKAKQARLQEKAFEEIFENEEKPAAEGPPQQGQPGYKRAMAKSALQSIFTKRISSPYLVAKQEEAKAEEQARADWIAEKARDWEDAIARAEAKGAAAFEKAAEESKSASESDKAKALEQDEEWMKATVEWLGTVEGVKGMPLKERIASVKAFMKERLASVKARVSGKATD